ncbi:MAG: MotA/TolQ/ExbB proton channel family protein [Planctomycetota bacterium]|nr:MotA/TolQ/ExbB proton channel family protein [Planctomycetota bacterium]
MDVVAGGIWAALTTTAAGLTVAIPVYIAFNFLERWADTIVAELENSATDITRMVKGGSF